MTKHYCRKCGKTKKNKEDDKNHHHKIPCIKICCNDNIGPTGPTGPTGSTGPIGPTGSSSGGVTFIPSYVSAFGRYESFQSYSTGEFLNFNTAQNISGWIPITAIPTGIIGFRAAFSGVYSIFYSARYADSFISTNIYLNSNDTGIGARLNTTFEVSASFSVIFTLTAGDTIAIAPGPDSDIVLNDFFISIIQIV